MLNVSQMPPHAPPALPESQPMFPATNQPTFRYLLLLSISQLPPLFFVLLPLLSPLLEPIPEFLLRSSTARRTRFPPRVQALGRKCEQQQ